MLLGAHESIAGGVDKAFARGEGDTCASLQIFTRSGRSWKSKPLADDEIARFRAEQQRSGLPVVAHGSYLVNLGSEPGPLREKSLACFADELRRVEALGCQGLVLHPGGHPDAARGIALIAEGLNQVIAETRGFRSLILVECTAGQGASVGHRFEHLAQILEQVKSPERVGICLDTCHLYASGYDLATPKGYEQVMNEFDHVVGLERVRAFHLNDCKKPLGSRVDRHEEIGKGTLGLDAFECLVNDPRFAEVVAVLETPDPEAYRQNLDLLRSLKAPRHARH